MKSTRRNGILILLSFQIEGISSCTTLEASRTDNHPLNAALGKDEVVEEAVPMLEDRSHPRTRWHKPRERQNSPGSTIYTSPSTKSRQRNPDQGLQFDTWTRLKIRANRLDYSQSLCLLEAALRVSIARSPSTRPPSAALSSSGYRFLA